MLRREGIEQVIQWYTLYYMNREILTVRVPSETKEALDAIAEALDRDRSYVVNDALNSYIEIQRWQIEHIKKGLREAKAGRFVPEKDVQKTISRLRRK